LGGDAAALTAIERDAAPWEARDKQDAPLATTALTPIVLHGFNPADWETNPQPEPRKWVVPGYIPDETVTLFYADGGTGKSYLKLQLSVARALSRDWIGSLPEPGRTLVLSCEDDLKEMKRRLYEILKFYLPDLEDPGARWKALGGEIRLVDLVGENSVSASSRA
jgi:AAA domain